jgi:hypothetical protein
VPSSTGRSSRSVWHHPRGVAASHARPAHGALGLLVRRAGARDPFEQLGPRGPSLDRVVWAGQLTGYPFSCEVRLFATCLHCRFARIGIAGAALAALFDLPPSNSQSGISAPQPSNSRRMPACAPRDNVASWRRSFGRYRSSLAVSTVLSCLRTSVPTCGPRSCNGSHFGRTSSGSLIAALRAKTGVTSSEP